MARAVRLAARAVDAYTAAMQRGHPRLSILVPLLLAGLAPGQGQTPSLSVPEFAQLHEALVPDGPETWQTIPWRVDLSAARREAAGSSRPLFMWSMNGHPLGCT